ncbi:hypothetical protein D9M69_640900 [compost metagenome]
MPGHTSAVDQHLERFPSGDRSLGGGNIGDIEHQRLGGKAFSADRIDRLGKPFGRTRRKHHMRARLSQCHRAAEADARRGSGNQSAFAVKAEGGRARDAHHSAASP